MCKLVRRTVRMVNPFEMAAILAAIVIGITGLLLGAPAGQILTDIWPAGGVQLYYGTLALGGLIHGAGLATMLRQPISRSRPARFALRSGLVAIGTAWGTYGLALLGIGTTASLTSGLTLTIIALAAFWRSWQIRREGRRAR